MSLQIDLREIINEGIQTNFGTKLLWLCLKADDCNIEKIRLGFPNAVQMVEVWRKEGKILDLPYD
ncbi:MAG: hypothetical protein KKD77_23650 [Gammaproteobacteria bacterium]|nr:hypothetical protein [Gammaproteobacteria bacterium]